MKDESPPSEDVVSRLRYLASAATGIEHCLHTMRAAADEIEGLHRILRSIRRCALSDGSSDANLCEILDMIEQELDE